MAVLIAALATSAVAFTAWRQQVRLRDAELRVESQYAQEISRATIAIARALLIGERWRDNKNGKQIDYLAEEWMQPRRYEVERGVAQGQLTDLQGRFNLNWVIEPLGSTYQVSHADLIAYKQLLANLDIPNADALGDALADWMDNDTLNALPNGAEDPYYLGLSPSYRAANAPLADLSDLRKVKGYTDEVIAKLEPHVSVLPPTVQHQGHGHLNVNLTTPEVLMAMFSNNLPKNEAQKILTEAKTTPLQFVQEIVEASPTLKKQFPSGVPGNYSALLGFKSNYFQLDLKVKFGNVLWHENVLLFRDDSGTAAPGTTQVLWRKRLPS